MSMGNHPSGWPLCSHRAKERVSHKTLVEELQGTSPTLELAACGGLLNLLHGPLCPVPLCVCLSPSVTSEETQEAMAGPLAGC